MTISAGAYHTCALRPNGYPVCWGSNSYGQTDKFSFRSPEFVAITSGGAHNCGLRDDGSWTCWGAYTSDSHFPPVLIEGLYGLGPKPWPQVLEQPEGGERFVAISSGKDHACGLRESGVGVCWGSNKSGQASPFPGVKLKAISSGEEHTCAIRSDDSPLCWSMWDWQSSPEGGSVQCPLDDRARDSDCAWLPAESFEHSREVLVEFPGLPPEGLRLGVISSGLFHTCALQLDGTPVCWGDLQIGEPLENQKYEVTSSGDSHTCKPREDGLDRVGGPSVCRGFESLMHEQFAAISSGWFHTCALRLDGSPVCWGSNWDGRASPPDGERFVAISSGRYHTCGLRVDGTAVCWGDDRHGQSSPPDVRFAIALGEAS